jgi:hypothetical protein
MGAARGGEALHRGSHRGTGEDPRSRKPLTLRRDGGLPRWPQAE